MGKRGEARRGIGLVTTLGFTGAIVLLAFVCLAACFAQLTLSTRGQRMSEAELSADCVAQLAGARLLADTAFGLRGTAAEKSLELNLPQGQARLTFDPEQAQRWGLPVSRNNLANVDPIPGYLRTIPAQSVQLIAQGQSGGRVRLVEVILNQPPFKWAVASTGKVHSTGGLKVFGVKDFSVLVRGLDQLPADQILPGHVVSDSVDSQALALASAANAPTLVTGDAQSMGGIGLGPSTTVNGQVKQHAESAKLPELSVESYDPAGMPGLQQVSQGSLGSTLTVSGTWRRNGDLVVQQGGLQMDQGYLYVDGDLEIYGGIKGKGAIFATGNVAVHGLSEFATENLQAIVAKGDLSLDGSGPENSSFAGLLMGGGRLRARQVSLVGSFVGTSREPGGSSIELDRVQLISSPQAIHLDFPALLMATQPEHGITPGIGQNRYYMRPVLDPYLDPTRFYDPVNDRLDPDLVDDQTVKAQYIFREDGYWAKSAQEMFGYIQFDVADNFTQYGPQSKAALQESYRDSLRRSDRIYQEARRHGLPRGGFNLDPNSFIQSSDKMRRLLWRVLE